MVKKTTKSQITHPRQTIFIFLFGANHPEEKQKVLIKSVVKYAL